MRKILRLGQRRYNRFSFTTNNAGADLDISLLDVKALYDHAYSEKEKARVYLKAYRAQLIQAQRLDRKYRAQCCQTLTVKQGCAS